MRKMLRMGVWMFVTLIGASTAWSQETVALDGPVAPVRFDGHEATPSRAWASVEYLAWWVRDMPATAGLVTTGDPAAFNAGFLIDPSTVVLFGDDKIDFGRFSGARITAGMWLDSDSVTGVELSVFFLDTRSTSFAAASDSSTVIAMPYTTPNGGPGAFFLGSPGNQGVATVRGAINVSTSSRFYGADLNSVLNAWRLPGDNMEIVLGLRYLDLQERLETGAVSQALLFDGQFAGSDSFRARNHFLGAQIGARWTGGTGRWSTSLAALIGLGGTNQVLDVDGFTTLTGAAIVNPGTIQGFNYTQPSNIGRHQQVVFSAVPQVQAKVGFNVLTNLRLTLGYDFICWTNVLRPTDQIDHVVNTTQSHPAIAPDGALRLTGEARPTPRMYGSSFWAQGLIAGMEFSW